MSCWRRVRADRFAVLIDGEAYFRAVRDAIVAATRSILILGWEFDSRTRLVRGCSALPGWPETIGELLDAAVRRRPGLEAQVLIWDSTLLYAVNREFGGLLKMEWLTHRRLHFRLDDNHPLGASHHQKVVVVDDALAFVGGLDITSQRWDSREHRPGDPRRSDPSFPAYPPFHDVMAMVSGPAAAALGDLVRARWRAATGETLRPPSPDGPAPWPDGVAPLLRNVDVAIARTAPPWDGAAGVREVERQTLALIAAARHHLFIENQYFASRLIAEALAARLAAADCPEVVVIGPGAPMGMMERSTMGVARARLVRLLHDADCGGRFGIYVPTVGGVAVKVHSKLMAVDDRWLRIGSSNLNNRSMGLDTECDLLVEDGPAVRRLRHELMAEHLGVGADAVAAAEAVHGGLHAAIAALAGQGGARVLVPLDAVEPPSVMRMVADSGLPDPEEPVETLMDIAEAMPGPARRPLKLRVRALMALLAGISLAAAAWRWAPPEAWAVAWPWLEAMAAARGRLDTAVALTAAFLVGGLVRLPVALLALAAGALLGPLVGAVQALAGALGSASLLYLGGRALGRARVRRLAGWRVGRINRALARHGLVAIVLLRLMPVAPFAAINLVAGASLVRFRDFALGTLLGMAPGVLAISVVGDRVASVLTTPSVVNIAVLGAATLLAIAAQIGIVNRLGRAQEPRGRSSEKE
ncbi:MAG: VTT domain-containing protein [Magnetospirillum sp.]|nr:VTT domain-containing protein [Magnetospirillum sp.]